MKSNKFKILLRLAIIATILGTLRFGYVIYKKHDKMIRHNASIIAMHNYAQQKKYTNKVDPIWNIDNKKKAIRIAKKNGVTIPFPYILGGFFGAYAIAIILFTIYLYQIKSLKKRESKNSKELLDKIRSLDQYGPRFIETEENLIELKKLNILNEEEYNQKLTDLISEGKSKLTIHESDERKTSLDNALKNGIISEEEYKNKLKDL